jgi:hypothetical protein
MPTYCPIIKGPCEVTCIFNVKFKCEKNRRCLIQHLILLKLGYAVNNQQLEHWFAAK